MEWKSENFVGKKCRLREARKSECEFVCSDAQTRCKSSFGRMQGSARNFRQDRSSLYVFVGICLCILLVVSDSDRIYAIIHMHTHVNFAFTHPSIHKLTVGIRVSFRQCVYLPTVIIQIPNQVISLLFASHKTSGTKRNEPFVEMPIWRISVSPVTRQIANSKCIFRLKVK